MSDKIQDFLVGYWQGVIDDLVASLQGKGFGQGSGSTQQEVASERGKSVTVLSTEHYKVVLKMPFYYEWLDEGVRGTAPTKSRVTTGKFSFKGPGMGTLKIPGMRGRIRAWMRNRGIGAPTDPSIKAIKNREKQLNALAYVIARSIWKQGLNKTDFYSSVVNEARFRDFEEKLTEVVGDKMFEIVVKKGGF
jgi:hypothetical protein